MGCCDDTEAPTGSPTNAPTGSPTKTPFFNPGPPIPPTPEGICFSEFNNDNWCRDENPKYNPGHGLWLRFPKETQSSIGEVRYVPVNLNGGDNRMAVTSTGFSMVDQYFE